MAIIPEAATREIEELLDSTRGRHRIKYHTVWVDKWTGEQIRSVQKLRQIRLAWETDPESAHTQYRKTLAPDAVTKQTCKLVNAIILEGRTPHPTSHGFEKGRDITSYAFPHKSSTRMLSLDLRDAFPQISRASIESLAHRLLGLSGANARYLAEMLTVNGRMVQGNPLSPQILNIAAHRLDTQLHAYAVKYGLIYTRYADDLTISKRGYIEEKHVQTIKKIVKRAGWTLNESKIDLQKGDQLHIAGQVILTKERRIVERRRTRKRGKLFQFLQKKGAKWCNRRSRNGDLKSIDMMVKGYQAFHYLVTASWDRWEALSRVNTKRPLTDADSVVGKSTERLTRLEGSRRTKALERLSRKLGTMTNMKEIRIAASREATTAKSAAKIEAIITLLEQLNGSQGETL